MGKSISSFFHLQKNMRHFLKNCFYWIATLFTHSTGSKATVLMYHSIAESDAFFAVHPANFIEQMNYLAKSGLAVRSLSDIVDDIVHGRSVAGSVAITFDDGYRDNHKHAYAILKERQFPATVFLATGAMGSARTLKGGTRIPVLSHEEVAEMGTTGLVEFGAHTVLHPDLSLATREAVRHEMVESKRVVESLTGKPCTLFAYPYGKFNDIVVEEAKAAGFLAAVTVREGLVSRKSDLFRLRRNAVDSSTSMAEFRGKISRAVSWYNFCKIWK